MLSKYFSEWVQQYFLIWLIGYVLDIKVIIKYMNPFLLTLITCIGYVLFIGYLIIMKKYNFEISFLVVISLLHFIPLYVSYYYITNRYAVHNCIILGLLYVIFIQTIGKDVLSIYLSDKHPRNWIEVTQLCRSKQQYLIPICFIYNIL